MMSKTNPKLIDPDTFPTHYRDRYFQKALKYKTKPWTLDGVEAFAAALRCTHCGFEVADEDRFPVADPNDRGGHNITRPDGSRWDYMRIPFTSQNLQLPQPVIDDSDFVFCSDCCAFRYMYDSTASGMRNQIPDRFHEYILRRYGISDPVAPAPSAICLAYLHETSPLETKDMKSMMDDDASRSWKQDTKHTFLDSKHTSMDTKPVGLSRATFYLVLSQTCMQITTKIASEFVPVAPEEEQMLETHNNYTRSIYQECLPSNITATLPPPIRYDANPDSDTECDIGMDLNFSTKSKN